MFICLQGTPGEKEEKTTNKEHKIVRDNNRRVNKIRQQEQQIQRKRLKEAYENEENSAQS